jgi:hypothetical protein
VVYEVVKPNEVKDSLMSSSEVSGTRTPSLYIVVIDAEAKHTGLNVNAVAG